MDKRLFPDSCRLYLILFLTGLIFLITSCKPGIPSDILTPEELEEVLYDYHLAQGLAESSSDSVSYRRYVYVQEVFRKHGITEAEFDSTMVWYSAHANYLNDIYKNLSLRYETELKAMGATEGVSDNLNNLSAVGDTANIWTEQSFIVMQPNWLDGKFKFVIEADSNIHRGDAFLWRYNARLVGDRNTGNEAYAALYIHFDNDSVAAVTRRIYNKSRMELRIETDTMLTVRSISGFIYYKRKENNDKFELMMLDDMMLVRFHRHMDPVVTTDTVKADTLKVTRDTLKSKNVSVPEHRMSPTEFRDSRPVERSINVVKEKPFSKRDVRHRRSTR